MFFYVRSITGASRCVSSFVASVQGSNIREFSNRQFLNHVKPVATTALLIEIPREIRQNSCICPVRESLVFSNNPIYYKYHGAISNQEKRWIYLNYQKSFIDIGTYSKDKTKSMNSAITKNTLYIRQMSANVPLTKEKDSDALKHVYEILCIDLPEFFSKSMDYKIYHPNLEFVNNIKGTVTKGLVNYIRQMAFLRLIGHLKFAYVKFEILKITKHPEENNVKVRWRIRGKSGINVLFSLWKFSLWKLNESLEDQEIWFDGYSTFYIGDDGLVFKHVADKMMPDQYISIKPKVSLTSEL